MYSQPSPKQSPALPPKLLWRVRALVACSAMIAVAVGGCRRKSTPPPSSSSRPLTARRPDVPAISCPPPQAFAALASAKGRALRTGCVVLYEGFYWGAGAVSWNQQGPARPTVHFLTGGPHTGSLVFDIEPAPAKELEALIRGSREVSMNIRRPRGDRALVRMGVVGITGTPSRPESREIGLLLQLVAHAPPRLLWWGPGDQSTTDPASGCVADQTVDFDLLFGTRLQRLIASRFHLAPGARPGTTCPPPSSTQDEMTYQASALKTPRAL